MALLTWSAGFRRRRAAWGAALMMLVSLARGAAAPPASTEYQLKAAFLFKLTQFVEWPARAFREADSPLVIGILGEDPFGAYLDELIKGEKIGGRPLAVRRYQRVEDVADCHILFFSHSEAATLEKSLAHLKGRSVLTVGDTDTFTQQGGMVRFPVENGKIRLKISIFNLEADKAGELSVSSKVRTPAIIVPPGKE
jgi:hypothetical protein